MNFTFGIITTKGFSDRCSTIITTIVKEKIPNYQIVIIGDSTVKGPNVEAYDFDESARKGWITKKKNLITEKAKFENIVYLHDYLALTPGWYQGYLRFGNDFKVCMNRIINADGSRYRDWTLWAEDAARCGVNTKLAHYLLPYDVKHLSKYQYVSGAYWVAKKSVMQEFPLDERLTWGNGEDVEWSKQIREKYQFSINPDSAVRILKGGKNVIFNEMTPEEQEYVRNLKVDANGRLIT